VAENHFKNGSAIMTFSPAEILSFGVEIRGTKRSLTSALDLLRVEGAVAFVIALEVVESEIVEIHVLANPEKLRRLC
jgi:hypothetical protein